MSDITGREPRIASTRKGERRLSLRRLGTILNVLSPESVSLPALRAALKSDDTFVRYNAAKMIGKRADRDARILIEDVLKDGETRERASIARHLSGFTWFSAEPLIRLALKDADHRVQEGAIYSLCDIRTLNAYQLMEEVLKTNNDDMLREAAAYGLRNCQDLAALPVLEEVLNADDPDVRIKGLEALGVNGNDEAIDIVHEAMNDPEPDVKYAATLSLLELSGEDWLEELSGVIGRTSGKTLEQVMRGFFHATNYLQIDVSNTMAADLLIDSLETALLDDMPAVRMQTIYPLAWMRHERMPGILRRTYILEQDSEVKAHIVRVASSLMSSVGDEILEDALKSPEPLVKEAADKIIADRERAGFVLRYDADAKSGTGLKRPTLGE